MSFLAALASEHKNPLVADQGAYKRLFTPVDPRRVRTLAPGTKPVAEETRENRSLREAARNRGDRYYVTVWKCKYGHPSLRAVTSGLCVECREGSRPNAETRRGLRKAATVARNVAKSQGSKFYHSVQPCSAGHTGLRYVSSYACVICLQERQDNLKDSERSYDRDYRLDNADRLRAMKEIWLANNKAKVRVIKRTYKARRKAQKASGAGFDDMWRWEAAAEKVCFYCGIECSLNYHVDHYVPLARGGEHALENLRIACAPCNIQKNATMPHEFLERLPDILARREARRGALSLG